MTGMFKNYLLTAIRNFRRHKVSTLINIAGLAIGVCASVVIFLIVDHEFSYDTFHKDKDHLYRVVTRSYFQDAVYPNSGVPGPLAGVIMNEVTGLQEAAAYHTYRNATAQVDATNGRQEASFKHQDHIIFADEHYFNLFQYQWLAGSAQSLKATPYHVVLTESQAGIYFPQMSPAAIVGHTIRYNDSIITTVSGIVKDLTHPTDLDYKTFISLATVKAAGLEQQTGIKQWNMVTSSSKLFVKTTPGVPVSRINAQLAALAKKYDTEKDPESGGAYLLQPITDIHFNTDYGANTSKSGLYGIMLLALFLLLLGCINFINLSTAQAAHRAKEIGVRKAMGSARRQLTFQFLTETFLLTVLAAILSILLAPLLLNVFKDFIPEMGSSSLFSQPRVYLFLIVLIVLVTLMAGFYPALVLSRYNPVLALKNQANSRTSQTRNAWLRRTLTVSQFIIAQFFLIATLVVGKQLHYTLHKDIGLKKEAIVTLPTPFDFYHPDNRKFLLLHELQQLPEIKAVSLGTNAPIINGSNSTIIEYKKGKTNKKLEVQQRIGDSGYIKVYDIALLAGRNLQRGDSTNTLLINNTLARQLGFATPQEAAGNLVDFDGQKALIAGVMADFNTQSLYSPINPLILFNDPGFSYRFHIALQGGQNWSRGIDKIKAAFAAVYTDQEDCPISFFDETVAGFYEQEQKLSKLLTWATGLSIFISCLGLLGLVIYTANQRTREIGIRKVLGASVIQIITLLSRDFVRLVLLAFVIAVPIAWWASHRWLENFAFRTPLSWWVFGAGGIILLFIALLILGVRSLMAAQTNPVKTLRPE